MAKNLSFGKVVAPSTEQAWAQAYTAGNLFAVLALTTESDENLNALGKEIFNNLQAEFFTLEDKNLVSIKQAILTATESTPKSVILSFCVGFVKDETLYLFRQGAGKAIIKRGEKIGVLFEESADVTRAVHAASGTLKPQDYVVLQTAAFAKRIDQEQLTEAFAEKSPEAIMESLSPQIQDIKAEGAAAIMMAYGTIEEKRDEPIVPSDVVASSLTDDEGDREETPDKESLHTEKDEESVAEDEKEAPEHAKIVERDEEDDDDINDEEPDVRKNRPNPYSTLLARLPQFKGFGSRQKIFVVIAVVIVVILIASIMQQMRTRNDAALMAEFQQVYSNAQTQYEEGMGLVSLNKTLAQDDFKEAKRIIDSNLSKFPEGSKERTQLTSLLEKVNAQLSGTETGTMATAKEVSDDTSSLLKAVKNGKGVIAATEDATSIYLLTSAGISKQNKTGGSTSTIVENDDIWENAVGLSTYQSNFYVLDTKEGIIKFVPAGDGYGNSKYFASGVSVDTSKAVSMAIDSSVYVLFSDGKVQKFTRGREDSFSLSNLPQPLSSPTKIFTNSDTDNLYILDRGNSRIVTLDKNGAFQAQAAATIIKTATDFAVSERDNKAYILSNQKVYELTLSK
jgi:type II secretory pathway pseudopilin PulG